MNIKTRTELRLSSCLVDVLKWCQNGKVGTDDYSKKDIEDYIQEVLFPDNNFTFRYEFEQINDTTMSVSRDLDETSIVIKNESDEGRIVLDNSETAELIRVLQMKFKE